MYSVFQGPPLRRYGGVHARSRGRAACAREDSMWPLLQQAFRHADDQPVESIGVVAGLLRFQRNTGSVIVLSSMCLPVMRHEASVHGMMIASAILEVVSQPIKQVHMLGDRWAFFFPPALINSSTTMPIGHSSNFPYFEMPS